MAKQLKITVNKKEYIMQHPGARWYIQHTDRCTNGNGVINQESYIDGLLKFVVVDPQGLTIDNFEEDMASLRKLVDEIEAFLK